MSIKFNTFIENNPTWKESLSVYQRDDLIFQRAIGRFNENSDLKHEYHACINVKTGDVYIDCRRRKIFAKHIVLTVVRPLHTIVKTMWHLSIIPPYLALQIFGYAKGYQTRNDLINHTVKSIVDIVRTPLYGIALTITNLAAIFLGCLSPNTLYKTREIAGMLERRLLRVDNIRNGGIWVLSPCFSPMNNLAIKKNTNTAIIFLNSFTKAHINNRKKRRSPFNDFFCLFPENKRYISAAGQNQNQPYMIELVEISKNKNIKHNFEMRISSKQQTKNE